jgi:hypothetical protein
MNTTQVERKLIGRLMHDYETVSQLASDSAISETSFSDALSKAVFTAMEEVASKGIEVGLVSVSQELGGDIENTMAELGTMFFDASQADGDADQCVRDVVECERRRRLIAAHQMALGQLASGGSLDIVESRFQAAGETVAVQKMPDAVTPYATRSWGELCDLELPVLINVWGWFVLGVLGVIFGQGGLGKSRIALNIARNQVQGLPFAGMPTHHEPLKHLFMGSENSIHRLQNDTRKMSKGLTMEQINLLDSHIRMATLEGPEDTHISLASPTNIERWKLTLEEHKPDVLWVDPWGDILDGEANSDEDTRNTIATLRRLLRRVSPNALTVVLAHSRTGAANIAQAIGYDSANFGKGSKALYSSARCVWNLAPGDESEKPPVVMVHGKTNDGPMQKPRALILDTETMTYSVDEGFDFEQWQASLSAAARGKRGPKKGADLSEDQAVEALGDTVGTAAEVKQILRDRGANKDFAGDLVQRLVLDGRWEQWRPPTLHAPTYIGTPEAIRRKRAEVSEQLQKKLGI